MQSNTDNISVCCDTYKGINNEPHDTCSNLYMRQGHGYIYTQFS